MAKKVAKFKVGDQVVGNQLASCYNITKPGWIGKVVKVTGTDYIYVTGERAVNEFVDVDRFDLYKAPAKKLEVIKIKDGDYFIATKKGVRGNAAKCCGVVTDYYEDIAVLAGTNLAEENEDDDDFHGFPTYQEESWDIKTRTIKDAFGFSTFEIVKDKRQIAIINAHKMVTVEGHSVTVTKDTVSFGCGSVRMKKGQAGVFIDVLKDYDDSNTLDTLITIREDYGDNIINDIQKLLTKVVSSGQFKNVNEFIELCDTIRNEGVEFNNMDDDELLNLEKLLK